MNSTIEGLTLEQWKKKLPLLNAVIKIEEIFWINPKYTSFEKAIKNISLNKEDIQDASNRLDRFAPFIQKSFPQTKNLKGIIESPLKQCENMHEYLDIFYNIKTQGKYFIKLDSHLKIAGSIKARGGIYEVLKYAEELVMEHKLLTISEDYSILASQKYKQFFSAYTIQVGSTGNLGLSIGIISAKLGFKVIVHMSNDAKTWKKELLRDKGVVVKEYDSDYSEAVKEGRKLSDTDTKSYFIDDENSENLFLGYSVAASRLKVQLEEHNITIDENNPLFVYLPCGVGGAPGGVAFGLKMLFKDNVHCFFVEPTHSPCMTLGMMTQKHAKVSVNDFGLDNITKADGLAVSRPSGLVGNILNELLSGIYTINDNALFVLLKILKDEENIELEPSACASLHGIHNLYKNGCTKKYIENHQLKDKMENSIHISWATGGSLVPLNIRKEDYDTGLNLFNKTKK